jgi:hypothetical protein
LLWSVDENAIGTRLSARSLYRVHDCLGLIEVGFPQTLRPGKILIHPLHHIRIVSEPFHAVVPRLAIDLGLISAVLEKASGQYDIRTRR